MKRGHLNCQAISIAKHLQCAAAYIPHRNIEAFECCQRSNDEQNSSAYPTQSQSFLACCCELCTGVTAARSVGATVAALMLLTLRNVRRLLQHSEFFAAQERGSSTARNILVAVSRAIWASLGTMQPARQQALHFRCAAPSGSAHLSYAERFPFMDFSMTNTDSSSNYWLFL